jgi:hypothetical protein
VARVFHENLSKYDPSNPCRSFGPDTERPIEGLRYLIRAGLDKLPERQFSLALLPLARFILDQQFPVHTAIRLDSTP